jgi:hypothetical protein
MALRRGRPPVRFRRGINPRPNGCYLKNAWPPWGLGLEDRPGHPGGPVVVRRPAPGPDRLMGLLPPPKLLLLHENTGWALDPHSPDGYGTVGKTHIPRTASTP